MEKNNKEKSSLVCDCDNCQTPSYHGYHRHFYLRWFLGLMILGIVFGVGFKLGEFKSYFDSLSGSGDWGSGHRLMMFDRGGYLPTNTQVPATTPSTTPSTKTITK